MRILLQRVQQGAVLIAGQVHTQIGAGLVALVGVAKGDTPEDAAKLAHKLVKLRIFEDETGKLNRSLVDVGGDVLAVSQFTLYADCRRGNRPGFEPAAPPHEAEALYAAFVNELLATGVPVQTGVFQAEMLVEIANDGPVTILLECRDGKIL